MSFLVTSNMWTLLYNLTNLSDSLFEKFTIVQCDYPFVNNSVQTDARAVLNFQWDKKKLKKTLCRRHNCDFEMKNNNTVSLLFCLLYMHLCCVIDRCLIFFLSYDLLTRKEIIYNISFARLVFVIQLIFKLFPYILSGNWRKSVFSHLMLHFYWRSVNILPPIMSPTSKNIK